MPAAAPGAAWRALAEGSTLSQVRYSLAVRSRRKYSLARRTLRLSSTLTSVMWGEYLQHRQQQQQHGAEARERAVSANPSS